MENKTNIAELLKDYPSGMELDCTVFDNVTFDYINTEQNRIYCKIDNRDTVWFTAKGCINLAPSAKCVIFPKGETTWEDLYHPYQFKDGDIVVTTLGNIAIIRKPIGEELFYIYGLMVGNGFYKDETAKVVVERLASEEEKQKLFDAIKDNGYRWNAETKTLEKLPKFKVGDVIVNIYRKHLNSDSRGWKIYQIENDKYIFTDGSYIHIQDQNNWELVPNKFDITTLVPFESRVLVRNDENQRWLPAFWGYKVVDGFITTFGWSKYCIPFEYNAYLLGTTNDCDDFYKTWEK